MVGDDETNFPHKLLLTNRQFPNLYKTFADKSSTDIKLTKTQLSKMMQSVGFLGKLLGPLLNTGYSLMKNLFKSLSKSVLIPLGLNAVASAAADAGIQKKILGSGNNNNTILIILNDEKDIVEIVESLEDLGLLLEEVSATIQSEPKEQRRRFLSMPLGRLGARLLGNILAGKGINRAGAGAIATRQGRALVRGDYGKKKGQKRTKRQDHDNKMDF